MVECIIEYYDNNDNATSNNYCYYDSSTNNYTNSLLSAAKTKVCTKINFYFMVSIEKILIFINTSFSCSFRFLWRTSRWQPCSATCGGGIRKRRVYCVSETTYQLVDDRYCTDEKPAEISPCAQQKCPKWRIGDWGQVNLERKFECFCNCFDLMNFFNCIIRSVMMIASDIVKLSAKTIDIM